MSDESEINKHPATEPILAAAALLHHYRVMCGHAGEIGRNPYYCGCEDDEPDAQHTRHVAMRWSVFRAEVAVRCYSIGRYVVEGAAHPDAASAGVALYSAILSRELLSR